MGVWFITGSSTGFGRVLADELLAEGQLVVATARRPEVLQSLSDEFGERVLTTALDVTDEASIAAAVAAAISTFGRIDVVVNNAGFGAVGAIEEFTDAEVRHQYDTNVFGALNVIRHTMPVLRAQGSGHILNITSVAGHRSRPGFGLYSSTKFALEAIGEALYHELQPMGIHVTNVEPGGFRTDFAGRSLLRAAAENPAYVETAHANIAWINDVNGKQPGDPAKAARAMIDLVTMVNPPLRLPLGKDSLAGIRAKLAEVTADLDRMEAVASSTDF